MISLGRAFARQALDDAFLRLLREAFRKKDREAILSDIRHLCEAHGRASRAIDRNLSR